MWTDPIVEELHEIRRAHAEKHGYDLARIVADLRAREGKDGELVVTRPPRLVAAKHPEAGPSTRRSG